MGTRRFWMPELRSIRSPDNHQACSWQRDSVDKWLSTWLWRRRPDWVGRRGLDAPSVHLPFPRRVGSRPRAGDRRAQAGELQSGLELLALEAEVRSDRAMIVQPRKKRGSEGVARPDRVDDLDRHGRNVHPMVAIRPESTLGAEGDDHHLHALGEQAL